MRQQINLFILLSSILIFPFLLGFSQTEQYKFRHLTTEDGLPSNKSWVVCKDSKGFIWIGTRSGLCRYDGYDIKVFQYESEDTTSLSGNRIIGSTKLNVEDNEGNLWIGTQQKGLNKFDPVSENFTRYKYILEKQGSISSDHIRYLYLDDTDILWIGTREGLNKYQPKTDDFKVFKPNQKNSQSFENYVSSIYEKPPGKLWIGTYEGLFEFDKETEKFDQIKFIQDSKDASGKLRIKTILEDKDGTILFGTHKGFLTYEKEKQILVPSYPFFNSKANLNWLDISVDPMDSENTLWVTHGKLFRYDKKKEERTYFLPDVDDPGSILGQVIYSIYFDETGMIWLAGTRGVNILNPETDNIKKHPGFADQFGSDATQFMKDSRNHIWISTADGKLIHFDQDMNPVKQYNSVSVDEQTELSSFGVRILFEDSKGNVWMGTNNKGLYVIEQGKDEFLRCKLQGTKSDSGPTDIFDIFEDSEGTLWIAGIGSLYFRKDHFPLSVFDSFNLGSAANIRNTNCVYEDNYGWLWIGTYNQGVFCRPAELKGKNEFINYKHEPGNDKSISNETVWAIIEDTYGDLWFATENGLNKFIREENVFERYYHKTEKGANCIWDMTSDNRGYLWMVTEAGLIRYKSKTTKTSQTANLNYKQILPFRDIYMKNIDKTADGKIYIGGADYTGNGYFSFHPDSISENKRIPSVYITEFSLRNKAFELDSSILLKKHIILKYNQNFFSFEFVALDYTNPLKNQYAYYLSGLEDNWIYCGDRRLANYTGISPGKYTFKVKGSNNDGYWNEVGTSVYLTILPPPWKTWWAYSLYLLFVIAILYISFRLYFRRQKLIHKMEVEQVQYEKLEELDKMKSRFFANISHEFRTPLTLILGPIEKLRTYLNNKEPEEYLNMMQHNALRLQSLINQLLNLSKLESGKMKLQTKEQNIVSLVNGYVQSFEFLAKQKKIDLEFKSTKDNIPLFIDRDKIEKILFNLLSNAFKFTGEGGRIEVYVTPLGPPSKEKTSPTHLLYPSGEVEIKIFDTGRGIPPEKLEHIFDRFYQADDTYTKDHEGTGIGLALTKELVELHYGRITVESHSDSYGEDKRTIFTVFLPQGKEHLKTDEIINSVEPDDMVKPVDRIIQFTKSETKDLLFDDDGKEDTKPLLLIIEDNDDLRYYIRSNLTNDYRLSEAIDGEMGFEKAIKKIPDLIISDVMMPKMDGYELCKKLKTDERTSHIPVILLTARASLESKIEGLETGADDFITKPFDPFELQTRIKNLIKLRKELQKRFMMNVQKLGFNQSITIYSSDLTSMDQRFLKKAKEYIIENISNPEFKVEDLAAKLSLSKRQLTRKLVAITGNSPNKMIRSIRLNRAAELLSGKTGNITEIAYDVGFNNLSWFAKSFKEQFGVLPSEFIRDSSK